MNKYFGCVLTLLLFCASTAYAQVNTDSLITTASTPAGKKHYQQLVEKLHRSDSTLQRADFLQLYYGSVAQVGYQLALIDSLEYQIKDYNLVQEFMQAYEWADSLLSFHPVSITAYFEKSFACYALKRPDEEADAKQKYLLFMQCALRSGDGSAKNPFVVVSDNDAVEVLKYLQVKYKEIQALDSNTLLAVLTKKYRGAGVIYFRLPAMQ